MIEEARSKILAKKQLNADTVHLTLNKDIADFQAGQFVMISEIEGKVKRAYSIASAPWEKELGLCIRRVEGGVVSPKLYTSKTQDEFTIMGPYGHATLPENEKDIVFLAVGTGIAPFRGMIRELFKKHYSGKGENTKRKVRLLFGCKVTKDIFYEEEFRNLAKAVDNFTYTVSLTREKNPNYLSGRLPLHVDTELAALAQAEYFICGGNQMVQDMKELLLGKGVTKESIHIEIHGVRTNN